MSPKKLFRFLRHSHILLPELLTLRKQAKSSSHKIPFGKLNPYPHDKADQSGTARGHYFHQDLLVARRVFENSPEIGSRIDGFVAHVASFRPIEVIDIRPLDTRIPNITFRKADLMQPPEEILGYCDSLSCLHVIEHFGLGRYGDPIDFEGHVKGLRNLSQLLRPGGRFYLSCPIGPQRIEFNAHRVFSLPYLIELLEQDHLIERFSYVDDAGDLHENVELIGPLVENSAGCRYGCGIFELIRK